ncbi:hypothetical protein D3C83_39310 [compost metagenome]
MPTKASGRFALLSQDNTFEQSGAAGSAAIASGAKRLPSFCSTGATSVGRLKCTGPGMGEHAMARPLRTCSNAPPAAMVVDHLTSGRNSDS